MTPVILLVAFCAVMSAVAVGRLAVDESRDYVDIGSTLVVVGITVLAAFWVTLAESLLIATGRALLGFAGACVVVVGVGVIVRYWDRTRESTASSE
ncbi:hypothetical protein [Natronorubrum halophilum]|uniref:hypothetical protein n=1 Tax=Natronorubrum halophilum TaxID=1702106 RepID=UPI0010C1FB93|nr:hypothetical protein [Natronorubrum halophilum]